MNLQSAFSRIPTQAAQALRPLAMLTVFALVTALGAHWGLYVPALDNLNRVQQAYQDARLTQVKLQEDRRTQEEARDLQRDLASIWERLPADKEFASMAIAISELGRMERVTIPGMSYSHKKGGEGLPAEASLSFQATGNYRAVSHFIHRLETTEPYLVIERLDAARAGSSYRTTSQGVRLGIRVVTFLKPEPSKADKL